MNNPGAVVHVGCAVNDGYAKHCAAMLRSLVVNHPPEALSVHLLADDSLSEGSRHQLGAIVVEAGGQFRVHAVEAYWRHRFEAIGRFGTLAWYRVLLPRLVPEVSRIVYLDSDMVVRRPLTELWQTDLRGMALGAVFNPLYPYMSRGFLGELDLDESDYFNSGLLLMDAQKWRDENVAETVVATARSLRALHLPDQNVLNFVFKGRWLPLSLEWNAQNSIYELRANLLPGKYEGLREARTNPAIAHYISHYKPDHFRCKHPFRAEYWTYVRQTPWRDTRLAGVNVFNAIMKIFPESVGWRLHRKLKRGFQAMGGAIS